MADVITQVGEAYAGSGPEAAHVNTVLGRKGGPVETAWATALATPRLGHTPFVAVLRPDLPAKPLTLFVNKAAVVPGDHARLTWGAAQAGVASGVMWAVADDLIDQGDVDDLLLIAAVWVDPAAAVEAAVYENNRRAVRDALAAGARRAPPLDEVMAVRDDPRNPYFGLPGLT
ncbi:MAG TPA: formaldehyde-activating enzyme [Acidimicrobiales bacterium]|nr:formaldehyde-activating enzyme [Acidimicrobiales bacterium]